MTPTPKLWYNNIIEIRENGHIVAKYAYDSLNRLIREDNKVIGKTALFTYDQNGNITERCEYAYTCKSGEELDELECTHYSYDYDGDRLVSYNGEEIEYDNAGNPTTYRGRSLKWKYGKWLTDFGGYQFQRDCFGRTTHRYDTSVRPYTSASYYYDENNNLIRITTGVRVDSGPEFIYDGNGLAGLKYQDISYFYRKDVQGNIIAILDSEGNVVVKYVYDAWGNHAVLDADGNDIEDTSHIGHLNPFRYRGYFYDAELGLYFLQTRYYDPETGRFISQDSIDYADPETINGLNLYAYCANNPVMNIDPTGEFFLSLLIAALVGAVVSAAVSIVTQAVTTGSVNWGQVGISALFGAVGGMLSFTGIGGVVGQFLIQGALAVGEMYSIAALKGTVSSISIAEVVATFLFAGSIGAIGAKNAFSEFKRVGQMESSFIKYAIRDISKGASIISTIASRGAKYFKSFILPTIKTAAIQGGVNAGATVFDFFMQKLYDLFH